ncbi:hypothetical protein DPX16_21564 [Anabarilius grahami]|uniref:Uncharacterized protein n=1 Tax=Anabarilius grahami TaxID=495550 RepID=A0A3N0XIW5_ANAGA|nr:hypothetical protein DPX16_21564 [Anabarilius grahami]
MQMDGAKIIADELNRGRYTENVLKYFFDKPDAYEQALTDSEDDLSDDESGIIRLNNIPNLQHYVQHTAGFFSCGKRVAGHANYWTFRGKQTHSANFGDGYIHKEDPDKEKVCPNDVFHWRQRDLQEYFSVSYGVAIISLIGSHQSKCLFQFHPVEDRIHHAGMDGLRRNCATGCRVDEAFKMDDLVDSISADTSGLRCGHVQLRIVFITPVWTVC